MPWSSTVPVSAIAAVTSSYACADPNCWVGPDDGHRPQAWYLKLSYPLSCPCQKGELAVNAISGASHGWMRSMTAIPSSSEDTYTCTWHPQVSCSCAVRPNSSAIRRYRLLRVREGSTAIGDVATAATCSPRRPSAPAAPAPPPPRP